MSTNIFSVYIMYKFCSLFIFFQIWGGGMAWSLWSPWHSCWPRPWNLNCRMEWHIRDQVRKDRKTSNMGEGMIPLAPLSPLALQLATAPRPQHQNGMTHQRPREKKIGELASTSPCHLLSSLRERQRSRRFRAMWVFYKELGKTAGADSISKKKQNK